MGEYAKYNGQEIKIGTCEQMYYLRADQVYLIQPLPHSVNPRSARDAASIRFRFPFPDEDNVKPGAFENYDRAFPLWGLEVPEDIEHGFLQFTRNYPEQGGIILSTPCPRSKEGKASKLHFVYNGYSGSIGIHSQRLVDGKLKLVLRCMDCGALWRLDTLEDAQPILDKLQEMTKDKCGWGFMASEVAERIVAGYTEPNFWTPKAMATA